MKINHLLSSKLININITNFSQQYLINITSDRKYFTSLKSINFI